jgi:hypothetical protein
MDYQPVLAKLTGPDLLAFILRLLRALAPNNCDNIHWRTDGEFAPVTFFLNTNDLFDWGSADSEEITPDNIEILESAMADCKTVDPNGGDIYGYMLFAARVNKMRPQNAAYPKEHPEICKLLDEAGPERPVALGNPRKHWSKC